MRRTIITHDLGMRHTVFIVHSARNSAVYNAKSPNKDSDDLLRSLNEAGILAYNDDNHAEGSGNSTRRRARRSGRHIIASLYYQGHGVTQDLPKAVELFTAAAQAGFPPSLANLALSMRAVMASRKTSRNRSRMGVRRPRRAMASRNSTWRRLTARAMAYRKTMPRRRSGTSRRPKPVPCRRRMNTACCTRKGRAWNSTTCRRMRGSPCRPRRAARNRSRTAISCWKSSRPHSSKRRARWRPSMLLSMVPIRINSYHGHSIIPPSISSLIIQ